MKKEKLSLISGVLGVSLLLAACQPAPISLEGKDPGEALQEGIKKLSDIDSYSYDVTINGDLKGPEGMPPAVVEFDLSIDGGIDLSDPMDLRMTLMLAGGFMADADGADAKIDFRLNSDSLFVNVMELTGQGSAVIPDEMKQEIVGKWWSLPIPPEALQELAASLPQGGDENLTEEQKQVKELVENTQFFKDVKMVGAEKVNGEDSTKFTAILDKDAFADFVVKAAEIEGTTVSEDDLAEVKEGLELIEFGGDMYISNSSGILNRVKATLTFKEDTETAEQNPTGTVTFDFSISDVNKEVSVDAPEGAEEMPIEALLGPMLGAPTMAPSMPIDPETGEPIEIDMAELEAMSAELPEGMEIELPEEIEMSDIQVEEVMAEEVPTE